MKTAVAAMVGLFVLAGLGIGYYVYEQSPADEQARAIPPASSSSPEGSLQAFVEQPRPLPELQFTGVEGAAMTLSSFRGKVVLLNVWATWCVPCRKEMPTLDRLQAQLGGDDFSVVTLSIDREGAAEVGEFYREIGAEHLSVYLDSSGKVGRDLNVIGLPTTLLINREGRELGRVIGPAEWDSPEIVNAIKQAIDAPSAAMNGTGPSFSRLTQRSSKEFTGPRVYAKPIVHESLT